MCQDRHETGTVPPALSDSPKTILANKFMHYAFGKWMGRENVSNPWARYVDDSTPRRRRKAVIYKRLYFIVLIAKQPLKAACQVYRRLPYLLNALHGCSNLVLLNFVHGIAFLQMLQYQHLVI